MDKQTEAWAAALRTTLAARLASAKAEVGLQPRESARQERILRLVAHVDARINTLQQRRKKLLEGLPR